VRCAVADMAAVARAVGACQLGVGHAGADCSGGRCGAVDAAVRAARLLTRSISMAEAGALEAALDALEGGSAFVVEQSLWCLANIAGDCVELRDAALHLNAVALIEQAIVRCDSGTVRQVGAWTLSNLCRGKPRPSESVLEHVFRTVRSELLRPAGNGDDELLANVLWTLSFIADGPHSRVQARAHSARRRSASGDRV